jgi:two-component system, NarL family, response regulator DesR
MIRILIADDENLIRAALTQLLELEDDITVVAQAATGRAALDAARPLGVTGGLDVAVLDLQMPELDGIAVATELVLLDIHSIIVTSHGRPGHLKRALAAGVRGFLPKTTEAARLAEVIRVVAGGGRYVDPQLAAEAIGAGDSPLTPREADCLELAADGVRIEDIAARVHLSPGTVRNYLSSAITKLGAANRHDACAKAVRMGWI